MNRFLPLTALAVTLSLAAACDGPARPTHSEFAGVYALEVPAGTTLTISTRPGTLPLKNVISGTLDLQPAWRFNISYRDANGSGTGLSGTYRTGGAGVVLEYDSGKTEVGTISGETLTLLAAGGQELVFRKVGS